MMHEHSWCRICGAGLPGPYLDLGMQPLANALVNLHDSAAPAYPLAVTRCPTCSLSQLTVVVDPDVLYANYPFRSGLSPAWRTHCEELADACGTPGVVLDIACNDGTQLQAFHDRGWECIGVDPAPATTAFPVLKGFWDDIMAGKYLAAAHPFADIVVAQNVLGHVDTPIRFLKAAQLVLASDGIIIVEVPDAERMIEDGVFDTIYHEHLSYWTCAAMQVVAFRAGLEVLLCEPTPVHGGSFRVWMTRAKSLPDYACSVNNHLVQILHLLPSLGRLLGYGAAAKATVLLNALRRYGSKMPEAVIDDTPEKQGLCIPGVRVPVIACPDSLMSVDTLWLLSWNNASTLKAKARERGFGGKFLLTTPEVVLLEE